MCEAVTLTTLKQNLDKGIFWVGIAGSVWIDGLGRRVAGPGAAGGDCRRLYMETWHLKILITSRSNPPQIWSPRFQHEAQRLARTHQWHLPRGAEHWEPSGISAVQVLRGLVIPFMVKMTPHTLKLLLHRYAVIEFQTFTVTT